MVRPDAEYAARFLDERGEPRTTPELLRNLVTRPHAANVRGLRALLWRAVLESHGSTIGWPSSLAAEPAATSPEVTAADADPERARLRAALLANGGSVEKTWQALGLSSRFALSRLLKKHGLSKLR
jgi:DNA-binding NtrC family response regulator